MATTTVVLLLVVYVYQVSSLCPNGFIKHGGSCYHIVRIPATWAESRMYCHAYGAKLVSIETKLENDFIVHFLKSVQASFKPQQFWIGGTDIAEAGVYRWEGTNVAIANGYTDWKHGHFDNGGSSNDEHCIELSEDNHYQWNDDECRHKYFPICEIMVEEEITGHQVIG